MPGHGLSYFLSFLGWLHFPATGVDGPAAPLRYMINRFRLKASKAFVTTTTVRCRRRGWQTYIAGSALSSDGEQQGGEC